MSSQPGNVEAKLDAIQARLDVMHADIKKFIPHGDVPVVKDANQASRPTTVQSTASDAPSAEAGAIPIGRGCRLNASSVSAGVASATCASPTFVPMSPEGSQKSTSFKERESSPVDAASSLNSRRKAEAARQKILEFMKPMMLPPMTEHIPELTSAPCVWLLSIALACSYISGEKITIEDILRQNRLGLYYVSFPSVTLAELFDVINEFLTKYPALKGMNMHCEVATFDTETVDVLGDVIGMGERLPIMSLSQFRKELSNNDGQSIYIVNFDPYTIEQHEIQIKMNYMELQEEECAMETIVPRWSKKNQGSFALILSFNSALHSVTLGTPILLEDGRIVIREHNVPVQVLYKALCVKDDYCNRPRGFVRIFINKHFVEVVPSIFPLNVLDGSLTGGMLISILDSSISPHILGLSLLHHVVCSVLHDGTKEERDEVAQQQKISAHFTDVILRGIPVTLLCQELDLGISTIVGGSNKSSVPSAFSWYNVLLHKLNMKDHISLSIVLVERRGGAEDGPVNITDDVFMHHIEMALNNRCVMLIGFNVNIALNVKVDDRAEPCHFAIVIGLDKERGIIRLADVNVKKYRKTWHVQLTWLHSAVIGYGYIIAAVAPAGKKEESEKIIEKFNGTNFIKTVLNEARYSLPPVQRLTRFEYPKKNYVVTILADAFDRLGFQSDVESVMNHSGFHVSFMLSEHLPLENAATVARNYSHIHLKDGVTVSTKHMNKGSPDATVQSFVQQIKSALQSPKSRCLIVNYQTSSIQANKAVWNGSNGGSYAIVLDFDEKKSLLTLSDTNHESFYRTWLCPLNVIFDAMCAMDVIAMRARGTLMLTASSQEDMYADCYGYDMRHSFVYHPFKRSVWPAFHSLALVASEMSNKDSKRNLPSAQYSAEDFLYSLSSFSVHTVLGKELEGEHIVALANTAFERLNIALEAKVVDVGAAGSFVAACNDGTAGGGGRPATMTLIGYDTWPIHRVAGFSAGVVNRVRGTGRDGLVQIVEGNGCTFGSVWERPAGELQHAVTAMVRIKRR